MAKKERIISPDVNEPEPEHWSNCLRVGDHVILSGMVSHDADGNLVGGNDPLEQSRQCFRNMKALVEAAGSSMSDVVKINVYLTDIRHRPAFVEARKEFFTGDFPTAFVVGPVTLAMADLLVEIDAWAHIQS